MFAHLVMVVLYMRAVDAPRRSLPGGLEAHRLGACVRSGITTAAWCPMPTPLRATQLIGHYCRSERVDARLFPNLAFLRQQTQTPVRHVCSRCFFSSLEFGRRRGDSHTKAAEANQVVGAKTVLRNRANQSIVVVRSNSNSTGRRAKIQ